ncbi:hypothetical protein CK203_099670 [Vitis vinifera]|uniref:Uncharacterized protein n=1 Tax=Vitis vinifera TaxID=29760 RepID=A0A438F1G6_VITVI|nr:hypothetical protein CK203_099670 [Vitis vinifera]
MLFTGKSPSSGNAFVKIPKHAPQKKSGSVGLENAEDSKHSMSESYKVNSKKSIKEHRFESFISDTDAFCCVCGSSNKDEINCLLECIRLAMVFPEFPKVVGIADHAGQVLKILIQDRVVVEEREDEAFWASTESGSFSVKSLYSYP